MFTTLIVFQVLLAVALIAIVLVQRGPGATMGAAFGAGASGTVFGSRGAGNFLTRMTTWLAGGFFVVSLSLAVLAANTGPQQASADGLEGSVVQQAAEPESTTPDAPALDEVIEQLDQAPAASAPTETQPEAPASAEQASDSQASDSGEPDDPPGGV